MRRLLVLISLAAASGLAAAQAGTERPDRSVGWPSRPVRLIVPYAAGGPVDISARLLAAKLQDALGQPVVPENRPGAGGNIGVDLVAKSPPDGYTLAMSAIATLAINPSLYPSLPYDPLKDLRHVTLLVQVPNVLIVTNDLPAKNVQELVALAKQRPGKLDFGSGSTGSTGHLAGEMFKMMTGTYMVHIPYKGLAPALPSIKSDKVRALATTTLKRSSFLPNVPTLDEAGRRSEAGLRRFDMTTWWGVSAPAKTPEAVIERLSAEMLKAMDAPDFKERLHNMGSDSPAIRTPGQFASFVAAELKTYTDLVRRSGARAD